MALDTEEEQVEKIQKFWEVYKRYIISLNCSAPRYIFCIQLLCKAKHKKS